MGMDERHLVDPDIKFIAVAGPSAQRLDQMVRHMTYPETMP